MGIEAANNSPIDKQFNMGVLQVSYSVLMNYFNEEHSLFRESLRDFLSREVSPNIPLWEKED